MTAIVGPTGEYLWRDGTVSALAPPSAGIGEILAQPTEFASRDAINNGVAVAYDRIYETQPFVAAAVNLLAGQVSRLPLKCYQALVLNGRTERHRDRESSLALALRNPAPRRSEHALKWDIALDYYVNGNHLERVSFVRGQMILQPLPWRYCQPIMNGARDHILGWKVTRPGEDIEELSNLDVAHFANGSPLSPLGISPLEQLGTSVQIDRAASSYQISTLRNSARMGVIVNVDPKYYADPEIRESIREEFTRRYTGPNNSGKPYVATGVDVKQLGQQTMVEADLIAQRYVAREEVAAVLQVPTMFLGDSTKATVTSIGEMHRQLYKTTLAPALDLISETFSAQVIQEHPSVAPDGTYVEFDASAILSGDPLERAKTYRELQAAGALTINETRDRENLPQFNAWWADEPMLPVNNLQPASGAFAPYDPSGTPEDPAVDQATIEQ